MNQESIDLLSEHDDVDRRLSFGATAGVAAMFFILGLGITWICSLQEPWDIPSGRHSSPPEDLAMLAVMLVAPFAGAIFAIFTFKHGVRVGPTARIIRRRSLVTILGGVVMFAVFFVVMCLIAWLTALTGFFVFLCYGILVVPGVLILAGFVSLLLGVSVEEILPETDDTGRDE